MISSIQLRGLHIVTEKKHEKGSVVFLKVWLRDHSHRIILSPWSKDQLLDPTIAKKDLGYGECASQICVLK